MSHLLLDTADRLVAQVAQDAVRRDVVVPVVGRVGHLDLNAEIGQLGLDDFGNIDHLVVFETEIESAAIDLFDRCFEQDAVEIDHVGHADIRTPLLSSVDGNDLFAQGIGGKLVNGQVKALARRIAADGGRADIDRAEIRPSR